MPNVSTMWTVARRPRWIAALGFALAAAAAFAALGQWQLARSIESAIVVVRATETVVSLESIARPDGPVTSASAGQLVSTSGVAVAGDYVVLPARINNGQAGYWVVEHVQTAGGPSLAVALGWTENTAIATSVAAALTGGPTEVSGRYLPTESPQDIDFEKGVRAMSTAALMNDWADAAPSMYGGYVVSSVPADGLHAIASPKPLDDVTLNWLNLFYAAEWAVFAGFAVFLWFRLVRDTWEREQEEVGTVN